MEQEKITAQKDFNCEVCTCKINQGETAYFVTYNNELNGYIVCSKMCVSYLAQEYAEGLQ